MSVIRPKPPEDPLEFAPAPRSAAVGPAAVDAGPPSDDLERARQEAGDAPLVCQPDRLLADYNGTAAGRTRATSELYAVLRAARGIRDAVDRVIVLGDADTTQGVRAVFASCCHPFHNELSRGERGGRPRLSFVDDHEDGDWLQGIVDLVAPAGAAPGADLLEQWGIVLCDAAPTPTTGLLLSLVLQRVGGDRPRLAERVTAVARCRDAAADETIGSGCPPAFELPPGLVGCRGVFTPATLLPAAIAGIDVVRLLQGAAAMNRRYREAAPRHNPVLQFVAASRRVTGGLRSTPRLVSADAGRLRDLVHWHERLSAATAGLPAAALEAAAPTIRLSAGEPRRHPLAAVQPGPDPAAVHDAAGMLVRWCGRQPDPPADAGPPSADAAVIRLPRIDEHAVGQLLQMLLLATVVEERLAR